MNGWSPLTISLNNNKREEEERVREIFSVDSSSSTIDP
jgi:hypothetical protein